MPILRSALKSLWSSEPKVATVFGSSPESCHAAVAHLRKGAPEIPVWLFSTTQPRSETAALCENVHVHRNHLVLLFQAQLRLWRRWVAISVGTWTGERGAWPLKLAPFLVAPFRTLLLNRHGDFFSGTPANIWIHSSRAIGDSVRSGAHIGSALWLVITYHVWRSGPITRTKDVSRAVWLLISYHLWRSGPVTRARDVVHAMWLLGSHHVWRSGPVTRCKDVTRSLGLLFVATILRWLSYPDRHLFRRLHGTESLRLPGAPIGEGVARFKPSGRRWDGAELEQFALLSDARWILWQPDGEDENVDDLLPLFSDEHTFAVSRQERFQAWNAALFTIAPFRALRPGEATQVLSPLSGSILVDRCKLLALGVPTSSLTQTAWMLLFWQAAAANWRSYSVGQSTAAHTSPQPDLPVEERAFILRVLADPELRGLSPSEPDLARGDIAFMPAMQSPSVSEPGRLKVLLVSPFLPYPLSHGGAVRIYNLCRALADRVDFTLVAFREEQDVVDYGKLHEIFRQVYVLDKSERASQEDWLPAQVRESQSSTLKALLAKLAREWKPDLLQIEYTHMAAFRESLPNVPAILVEHDLTFSLYRQLAAQREYERWLAFERHWLHLYDAVWTVSDDDRDTAILEGNRRPDRTFSIANGVDTCRFLPCDEPQATPEILYVGSFRHLPNVLGFQKLLQEIMPRVWSVIPNVRLRVVAGPEHERYWTAASELDHRIDLHGFVEDLRPLYAKASVAVAPLEVSAGTNIKVLEAMACGKAVVTTPIGCSGLGLVDGYDALIRGDWSEFSNAVCALLASDALRSRVAGQARQTAEQRFSWTSIANSAYRSYVALAGYPQPTHEVASHEEELEIWERIPFHDGSAGHRTATVRERTDAAY